MLVAGDAFVVVQEVAAHVRMPYAGFDRRAPS